MPEYTYRREDGTMFSVRQKFSDDPLTTDPETGQKVVRVVQPTGVIFKGSGFYVNDSKTKNSANPKPAAEKSSDASKSENSGSDNKKAESKSDSGSSSSEQRQAS
jgi:predicted nucleic acid-binding Zn ribbon protein